MAHKILIMLDDKQYETLEKLANKGPGRVSLCQVVSEMVTWRCNRIYELEEQNEKMKSCINCGKYHNGCDAWMGVEEPPIHNVNDGPCDEWELE